VFYQFNGHYDTLHGSLRLLVRHIADEHPVERALTHADAVLATEHPTKVLARQQEPALQLKSLNQSVYSLLSHVVLQWGRDSGQRAILAPNKILS